MEFPKVSWLKSPATVTGQDPLGTKYPSEDIYSKLLPGLTNVTDRLRYYSFYPWLIRAFEKHQGRLKKSPLYEVVRRADCLFSLIGLHHNHKTGSDNPVHGGLTGSRKLSVVMNDYLQTGEPIVISKYANREDALNRYFQNKFGGLGQYYLGPLKDALILGNNEKGEICYTDQKGKILAEAFDSGVDGEMFFEVLERDKVTAGDLESLGDFCPCRTASNEAEQEVLADFLFNRSETFSDENTANRRQSLVLILDFIEQLEYGGDSPILLNAEGIGSYLECCYAAALPNGSVWEITDQNLLRVQTHWRHYYANELLSFAIQSLFWAGLKKLESVDTYLPDSKAYGKWFANSFAPHLEFNSSESVGQLLSRLTAELPAPENLRDKEHEIQIVRRLFQLTSRGDSAEQTLNSAVNLSVKLLLTVASRSIIDDWSNRFTLKLPAAFQKSYPINIHSFSTLIETIWQTKTIKEWISVLAADWNIEVHLQAALRKLRYETSEKLRLVDTFKILPTERGLEIVEIPAPGFTNPRLKQSLQILADLGALEFGAEGHLRLAAYGERLLEANRNG